MSEPRVCDEYIGNVCSGFGGRTVCRRCGVDRFEHPRGQSSRILPEGWREDE